MPAAGGLKSPLVLVNVVTDGIDTDYRVFKDTDALNMDAEALLMALSKHAFYRLKFEHLLFPTAR